MKKIIFTIALALPVIAAFPQTKNILMPSDLIMNYSVPVSTNLINSTYVPFGTELTPKTYLYFEVKPGTSPFGKYVLEGIKNKVPLYTNPDGVPGYEPNGSPLKANDIERALGIFTDTITMLNEKNVEETKIIKGKGALENDFPFCKFTEKWFFNPDLYSFKKTVVQYMPCRNVYFTDPTNGDPVYKGLMPIGSFLSKNNTSATTKLLSIRYEFAIGDNDQLALKILNPGYSEIDAYAITEKRDCPYWNSYNRQKFLDALINPVLSGKVKVTDFNSGAQLDLNTVRKNLGESADTITMVNPLYVERDTTMIIKRPANTERIWSIIFVEEWFINPLTLDIRKQVVGIAPVCWYYTTDPGTGEFDIRKKIAFLIKLN